MHTTARGSTTAAIPFDATRWYRWRLSRATALGTSLSPISRSPKLAPTAQSWAIFRGAFNGLAGENRLGTQVGSIRLDRGVPAGPDVAPLRTTKPGSMKRAPRRRLPVHGGHDGTLATSAKKAWKFPLNHARHLVGWQRTTRCSHEFSNPDQGIEQSLRGSRIVPARMKQPPRRMLRGGCSIHAARSGLVPPAGCEPATPLEEFGRVSPTIG